MSEIQVLEFELGSETYCVGIDCVTEIVDPKRVLDVDEDRIRGIVQRNGDFVIGTAPESVNG